MDETRETFDGLDVRAEFDRLRQLNAFTWNEERHPLGRVLRAPLVENPPKLTFRRYNRVLNKNGSAWLTQNRVSLNLHTGIDQFDVQETLIHELTHLFVGIRHNGRQGHNDVFWRALDAAFEEAYGPLTVAPRTNRFHGRYADALRRVSLDTQTQQALTAIDEVLGRGAVTAPTGFIEALEQPARKAPREPVGVARLPEPLRSIELQGEPRARGSNRLLPIDHWLNGRDDGFEHVGAPIYSQRDVERVTPQVADARVLAIIKEHPWMNRGRIDREYRERYGPYPGKSAYNSIWRLRRDGLVERLGHKWRTTREGVVMYAQLNPNDVAPRSQ